MPQLDDVDAMPWGLFTEHMREAWHPGEHWAVIGATGEGKSTFTGQLVKSRRFVLALDVKGGDETLKDLGWPRLLKWPPSSEDRRAMREGETYRRVVGGLGRAPADKAKRRALFRQVVPAVEQEGGWTLIIPDFKQFTDTRFGDASDSVEELLLSARDAKVSVITEWQRPAGVPRAAGDQASYLAISYTRDIDMASRLGEMMGRSWAAMRGAISGLGSLPHGWLIVSRRPRDPIILTRPPAL